MGDPSTANLRMSSGVFELLSVTTRVGKNHFLIYRPSSMDGLPGHIANKAKH